ncbi:MAG: Re/Si-specific NAD(P)(+) transhydrogenase subunit alpha [Phycisphaera sp.]|nr:Re/Si-specific NAD(P)(+) transhydrogenase subunit alpha [Phycisphaera sp.]
MKIFVARQTVDGETRAATTPAVVKKLIQLGATVAVESGTGAGAGHDDAAFGLSGAEVSPPNEIPGDAQIILTIHAPNTEQAARIPTGCVLVGMLSPLKNQEVTRALAAKNITSFSMEFIPRISRAQPMDVLSSQANIAGYKAVILAADACPKMYPMMITAAGTISPSKVFIIGAGVAGLQAIATAKRLGAVVEAIDVRAETKEQVQSLGAKFVELPSTQQGAATGGYAKEQTEEQRKAQQELQKKHILAADCVITTAAVFGKAPPMLIPKSVVDEMQPGSVLVDMAADPDAGRGNCEATRPGKRYTTPKGVTVIGSLNLPALVPAHATQAYANNMLSFLKEILIDKQLKLNLEDEIQKGACITHGGKIVNEMVAKAIG